MLQVKIHTENFCSEKCRLSKAVAREQKALIFLLNNLYHRGCGQKRSR